MSTAVAPSAIWAAGENLTLGVKSLLQYTEQPSYIGVPVWRGKPGAGYGWRDSSCREDDRSGYKSFYDTMTVAVNTLKRLDGTNINVYRSIWTDKLEMVAAKITDTAVVLDNGVHVGMSKEEVFKTVFKSYPKSYTADINVLKVIAGAAEVGEIYTFKGNKLRHIQIISRYKYY